MLVLTRKKGESIVLPSLGVVITVTAVSGSKARLGVTAPPNIEVLRAEVKERDGTAPCRTELSVSVE